MSVFEDRIREEADERSQQWFRDRVEKLLEVTGITRAGQLQHNLERHDAIRQQEQIINNLPGTLQNGPGT